MQSRSTNRHLLTYLLTCEDTAKRLKFVNILQVTTVDQSLVIRKLLSSGYNTTCLKTWLPLTSRISDVSWQQFWFLMLHQNAQVN